MKPSPNAAPISAMPLVRSFNSVVSAIYAWAVEIVAPATPAPIRETNNSTRFAVAAA